MNTTGMEGNGNMDTTGTGTRTASELLTFDFKGKPLRGFLMDDTPWFLAKDACDILGTETRDLRRILDADEVRELPNVDTIHIDATGGRRPLVMSEAGLYRLVMRSRKPAAKEFQRWVTHDVLPTIRHAATAATTPTIRATTAVPTMPTILSYGFHGNTVRVVMRGGEPWFVLTDVCKALGLTNARNVAARLDDDSKDVCQVDTPGGAQNVTIVNEAGLYEVILRSDKPGAKPFRRWVTHDVLPTIRRTGAYMTPATLEKALDDPDFLIGVLTRLKEEKAARARAEATLAEQAPKVLFADSVAASDTSILIGDFAKDLRQNGVPVGQNRLFAWLRRHHYLCSKKGGMWNQPTQWAMEHGWFEVKSRVIDRPDGTVLTVRTTKVTGKGRIHLTGVLMRAAGTPKGAAA